MYTLPQEEARPLDTTSLGRNDLQVETNRKSCLQQDQEQYKVPQNKTTELQQESRMSMLTGEKWSKHAESHRQHLTVDRRLSSLQLCFSLGPR